MEEEPDTLIEERRGLRRMMDYLNCALWSGLTLALIVTAISNDAGFLAVFAFIPGRVAWAYFKGDHSGANEPSAYPGLLADDPITDPGFRSAPGNINHERFLAETRPPD